jgi:hypothetical protein
VSRLVLEYYVVLDSILRDKPEVRHLLAWCRHCGIPFIRDPRNAGREDLGCPFGCADLHRRRGSNERSTRYNSSPEGKRKRYRHREERLAAKRSAAEASKAAEVDPPTPVEAAQGAVSQRVESPPRDRQVEPPCPSPAVPPPANDRTASSGEFAVSAEDRIDPSPREPGLCAGADAVPAGPERAEFDPGIVSYIRVVISVLEGRRVHREEILEMLARAKRQRSFAREKRVDYVLRRLREEPEKPP